MNVRYTLILCALLGASSWGFAQEPQESKQTKQQTTDSIASEQQLQDLEVVAYRKVNKGNLKKQIFELKNQGVPPSITADQALRFVPNLIDGASGYNILGSNKTAKVFIDGMEASSEEIKALPAKEIWRVELIRGGIDGDRIDIRRLRSLTRMFKGNIGLGARIPMRHSINSNLIWQSPTFNIMLTPTAIWSKQEAESMMERKSPTQSDTWHNRSDDKTQQANGTLRLNYYPNKHWDNSLVFQYSGYEGNGIGESTHNAQAPQTLIDNDHSHEFHGHLASKYSWGNRWIRLRGILLVESDQEDLKVASINHQAKNNYRSLGGDLTYRSQLEGILGKHQISTYYSLSYREVKAKYSPIEQNSLIHTLMLGDEITIDQRWNVELLLRLQYDTQRYATTTRKGIYFTPSATIYYNGDNDGFSLSYDQSVFRPSGQILDPTRYYKSETEYVQGNPDVANEITHSLSLSYQRQIKSSYLSASLAYDRNNDIMGVLHSPSDPNLQTWDNIGKSTAVSLSLGFNTSLFERKLNLNLGTRFGHIDNQLAPEHSLTAINQGGKGLFYGGNLNLSYTTSKKWSYMIYAQWSGRNYDFSSRQDYAPRISFEIDKELIKDKLSLSLSILNPWGTGKNKFHYFFRDLAQSRWRINNQSSGIGLRLTYRFGKKFRTHEGNNIIEQNDRRRK